MLETALNVSLTPTLTAKNGKNIKLASKNLWMVCHSFFLVCRSLVLYRLSVFGFGVAFSVFCEVHPNIFLLMKYVVFF